ncbi:hypothetical protein OS493_012123 [Desmophyllum pertusum]|uniref:Uncharacterized protein n=1 Tax=Desmophyllum pertusum TaxID=174260 RepID=A0A9X0DBZ0_9CNID|nr:hypothetical protein OS493_012123 [Desmophyllum pertusum]
MQEGFQHQEKIAKQRRFMQMLNKTEQSDCKTRGLRATLPYSRGTCIKSLDWSVGNTLAVGMSPYEISRGSSSPPRRTKKSDESNISRKASIRPAPEEEPEILEA